MLTLASPGGESAPDRVPAADRTEVLPVEGQLADGAGDPDVRGDTGRAAQRDVLAPPPSLRRTTPRATRQDEA
jgi:hypothetical protein